MTSNDDSVATNRGGRSVHRSAAGAVACAHCLCAGVANNIIARRLLGLCPLLAMSTSVIKGFAIGILLLLVCLVSACLGSVLRASIFWRFKPIYFATLASVSTVMVVNAAGIFFPVLIEALGVYALLLAANCVVIAQLQELAEHTEVKRVFTRVARDVLWVLLFVSIIAFIRELGAFGSLLHDISMLENSVPTEASSMWIPIFARPAGALFVLALLLALINYGQALARNGLPTTRAQIGQQAVSGGEETGG